MSFVPCKRLFVWAIVNTQLAAVSGDFRRIARHWSKCYHHVRRQSKGRSTDVVVIVPQKGLKDREIGAEI